MAKKKHNPIHENFEGVLRNPRITEKAAYLNGDNVYTFDVSPRANKTHITRAIQALYGVTPEKVATITMKGKSTFVRGVRGKKAGFKKALVYLKDGDTIEL